MVKHKTNTLEIKTPEGIIFSLLLAGPVTRFLAWSIDLACVLTLYSIIYVLIRILIIINVDFAYAILIILYFIISMGYSIFTEWYWQGQTIGKRLFKLRVMDEQGLPLQFNQVIIRNLLRVVDMIPYCYFVGGIVCFFNEHSQRLGDLAANTIVIRLPKVSKPDLDQILPGKFNSFHKYPHLEARIKYQTTSHEAFIALQALIRRDRLYPEARIELFNKIAKHFKSKVKFPEEVTENMSDEQYIRNIVEILFQ